MTTEELTNQVKTKIGEFLEQDASYLTPDSKLYLAFDGIDSLRMFEMAVFMEECFEVEFDELNLEMLETLGDLVAAIEDQLKNSNESS